MSSHALLNYMLCWPKHHWGMCAVSNPGSRLFVPPKGKRLSNILMAWVDNLQTAIENCAVHQDTECLVTVLITDATDMLLLTYSLTYLISSVCQGWQTQWRAPSLS